MPYLEKLKDYFNHGESVRHMRPNELREYYENLRATENDVLRQCADKAVPQILLGVLLHEIGHNLGLRHNFYGSIDKKNFDQNDEGVVEHPSSSVMEYTGAFSEMPAGPRAYDRAAIRFGYANAVKLKDETLDNGEVKKGEIVTFSTDKSMTLQLAERGEEKHEFLYCSDLRPRHLIKLTPCVLAKIKGQHHLKK